MVKKRSILKMILIVLLLIPLILPFPQRYLKLIPEQKLGGYTPEIHLPVFSKSAFLSGQYQEKLEKYVKRTFGFRARYVRVYNQLQYSLFNEFNLFAGMIEGKEGVLFAQQYITSHVGEDFIGQDSIDRKINKLRAIQDTLLQNDQRVLPVIAASKGTFYEEFIPDRFLNEKTGSNYDYYVKRFDELGMDYIDFNAWFLEIKGKKPYPLYPKLGIHWSVYGAHLAADSLVRFVETQSDLDLPDYENVSFRIKKAEGDDVDIEQSLNLMFKIKDKSYAYPEVSFQASDKDTVSVLVIADSFFYTMNYTNILQKVFSESDFWYYNNGGFKRDPLKTEEELFDLREKIEEYDYFILLANEAKLHSFAWNFIEDVYNAYFLFQNDHLSAISHN